MTFPKITRTGLLLALLAFCLPVHAYVMTNITVQFTNAVFGTSNYMTITVNGDTRKWTNTVYVPATQVLTNSTQSGSASSLFNHLLSYPFANVGISQSAATNVVLTTTLKDGPMIVSVSAGWATLLTNTPTYGVSNIPVIIPPDFYPDAQKTNVFSAVAAMINSDKNTNSITKGITATNPVFYGLLTVTNPATGKKVTATNGLVTAEQFVASGSGQTNIFGYSDFTNAANGFFLYQGADGLVSNSANAITLTNLPIQTSLDVPISLLFSNNIGDGATLTRGNFAWMTNAGFGAILAHTNGTAAVTNCVRFRHALPWDWDGATVKVGLVAVCSGTNSQLATNCVYAVRATALKWGTDLSTPTWGTLGRVTNNVGMGAWTNGMEGITAALTIGGTASPTNGILWEIQRHGGDGGDTETNADLFLSQVRIYYRSNTKTNVPASTP